MLCLEIFQNKDHYYYYYYSYFCNDNNLNWNLVRKHATVIENYCKKYRHGRIPGKHEIPSILFTALEDYDATCGQALIAKTRCKSKGNPTKETLEHAIWYHFSYPRRVNRAINANRMRILVISKLCRKVYRTLPKNEEEEHSQLELAISASMNVQPTKESRGIECSHPSKAVV